MKFGPVPLDDAVGAILAHSISVAGRKFKKGQTLGADEVSALRDAGLEEVAVARLAETDVPEDDGQYHDRFQRAVERLATVTKAVRSAKRAALSVNHGASSCHRLMKTWRHPMAWSWTVAAARRALGLSDFAQLEAVKQFPEVAHH